MAVRPRLVLLSALITCAGTVTALTSAASGAGAAPAPASASSGSFVPAASSGAAPSGAPSPGSGGAASDAATKTDPVVRTIGLPGGKHLSVTQAGIVTELDGQGRALATRHVTPSTRTRLGRTGVLPDDVLRGLFSPAALTHRSTIVASLDTRVRLAGAALPTAGPTARRASTSDATVNTALRELDARSITPLATAAEGAVVIDVGARDLDAAARRLARTPGVRFAEANRVVSSQSTGTRPLPAAERHPARTSAAVPSGAGAIPTNYAVTDSLSAWLNGNGVDAMGAYSTLTGQYGQLPGAGEIITNVSVGDLTDQAMADKGDQYVQYFGPTTVVQAGQRYLDLPSMPLIPTYVAGPDGSLNPKGTTEGVDPTNGEILLDFGVMAPLPHNLQRSAALGSGNTDLLGIAPGAKYRLVVPKQPTFDQIAVAMLAAARQQPRPNVITASLGEGTDTIGYPGRYLEDDPLLESVIDTIVHQYGIAVTISANDGTRLYTPTAVNPDGGSTPTDVVSDPDRTTTVDDDALSTTPSKVLDSGATAVGATTLDDVLTQPGQPTGTEVRTGTFATTRVNGSTAYSSGFGTRVNVSAPGDGIAVFEHTVGGGPRDVTPGLSGGTSASAPMVAAAAAVVQQASRLAGKPLGPAQIRSLLQRTGRPVASPQQSDRPSTVGPQLDLSAAVRAVLGKQGRPEPGIVRVSVAHHVDLGNLEGDYSEDTDPQRLDLSRPPYDVSDPDDKGSGEGLLGPVTFGVDTVGLTGDLSYELHVGTTVFRSAVPAIRISPSQLLTAAGDPVVSDSDRHVDYTVVVQRAGKTVAQYGSEITVGPTDGTYTVARAPVVAPRASLGSPVQVSYDLTGVRKTDSPRLVVSTVGHWSPTAGTFAPGYSVDLSESKGTLTLPASAFTGGGGLYGVGIAEFTAPGTFTYNIYGDMASILVGGPSSARPAAPLLTAPGSSTAGGAIGHSLAVTRARPAYDLHYDVSDVPGAAKAIYELSASGPSVFGAYNTVTNAFGTQRDVDGVSTPSTSFTTVDATKGTLHLTAADLPTDAVLYNVRVFGADTAGHPLGEASPTSALEYDDGLPGNGGIVTSFDAVSGADSVVAVSNAYGGQTVYHFDPVKGRYGRAITRDAHDGSGYQVLGVDTVLHRVALLHFDTDSQQVQVETWSTSTGEKIGADTVAVADYLILGGRVDTAHHRALLLERRGSDGQDFVSSVDLTDAGLSTPIDTGSSSYYGLEVDPTNGDALLFELTGGSSCANFGSWPIGRVDPDTGTATHTDGPACTAWASPDAAAGSIETLTYRSFSVNFAGNTVLGGIALGDGTAPAGGVVRQEPPALLDVDGVNGVVLAGFALPVSPMRLGTPFGYPVDSNATGQLVELDPATGATTKLLTGMQFQAISAGVYNKATERRVQLDPVTRTAWTFSSDGAQLQALHY